jgi:hypothetical protein
VDAVTLVEEQTRDGKRLVDRLRQEGVPVRAAGWVKPTDGDRWSLYLVTPLVDERGPIGAYRDVYRHLRSLGNLWITDSDVKLVGEGHPTAKDLIDLVRRHPGVSPIRSRRPLLGGEPVEEVYVYPEPIPKPKRGDGHPFGTTKVRLKTDVEQKFRDDELLDPLTPKEEAARDQIIASGVIAAQAEYFVRMRREIDRRNRPPIPAGTVVDAWVTAWWGDSPDDDPNPLLEVESPDGAQGLTFKENTEPA